MKRLEKKNLEEFFEDQITNWSQAQNNYHELRKVKSKSLKVNGFNVKIQYNPARIVSSFAKVDDKSIMSRKCFLCDENRPSGQGALLYTSSSGNEYKVLVNPFPIFPKHFTIPSQTHIPQTIEKRYEDMLDLLDPMEDYVIFYNGPQCGASAPDHLHFQAGSKGFLPMEVNFDKLPAVPFFSSFDVTLSYLNDYVKGALIIESQYISECVKYFYQLIQMLPVKEGEHEPMLNVLVWKENEKYITVIIPREKHRPSCFFADGLGKFLITPAAVEFGGVFILPLKMDYWRMKSNILQTIISEVCIDRPDMETFDRNLRNSFKRYQPNVSVGLMSDKEVNVNFLTAYKCVGETVKGEEFLKCINGRIVWREQEYDELFFDPGDYSLSNFEIEGVTIGIHFHWERKEKQKFQGGLVVIVENDELTIINLVGVEDYLTSVIASEMNSNASKEFLKAHAVISRSWLMAQIEKSKEIHESSEDYSSDFSEEGKRIKWYDREDHVSFDVCADDHCQRYQGVTKVENEKIRDVINETWGKILKYEGKICDARFSKCCGGISEEFSTCWEDQSHPYLKPIRDNASGDDNLPDMNNEKKATRWIESEPDSFCNTRDVKILGMVLNNYDQETTDFYRWTVEYSQEELAAIVKEKTGVDFGELIDIIPVKRGPSGRIYELKIVGMNASMVIGKELEIRRALSKTHLYSSAFTVKKSGVYFTSEEVEIPANFTLTGAGWGHGVGLCQIGAAVMGEKGYKYDKIFLHYFTGAMIDKIY